MTCADIITRVARRHSIAEWRLKSHARSKGLDRIRKAAYLECRAAGFSYSEIGRAFNRDHTTVLQVVNGRLAMPRLDLPEGWIDWEAA